MKKMFFLCCMNCIISYSNAQRSVLITPDLNRILTINKGSIDAEWNRDSARISSVTADDFAPGHNITLSRMSDMAGLAMIRNIRDKLGVGYPLMEIDSTVNMIITRSFTILIFYESSCNCWKIRHEKGFQSVASAPTRVLLFKR